MTAWISTFGAVELVLLGLSLLLLASVWTSKLSDRFGVPALLLFLGIGILAGSEGPGRVDFDDPAHAQFLGVAALVVIVFSGALRTEWRLIRPVLAPGAALASVGVLVTAVLCGVFVRALLGLSWIESLLVGATVSSTDAAAVFSILRSREVGLRGRLTPLLEFESGSNDPMAVFLTIGLVQVMTRPLLQPGELAVFFGLQAGVGVAMGVGMGRLVLWLLHRFRSRQEGLYDVMLLASALLTYAFTSALNGSGFLAVYLAGLIVGNHEFPNKAGVLRFHDGMAWLMQVGMFLTLGLLVFPSHLKPVMGDGMLFALFLILVARPASVFLSLVRSRLTWRDKAMVSWVGLRGAVPIVLATYPLLAGVEQADMIFNLIFFVVVASLMLQGPFIPLMARWLDVAEPGGRK